MRFLQDVIKYGIKDGKGFLRNEAITIALVFKRKPVAKIAK